MGDDGKDGRSQMQIDHDIKVRAEVPGEWLDVTEDGLVRKFIVEKGDEAGGCPAVLTRAYVHMQGTLVDGTVFMDYSQEEHDFMLGHAHVPKGVEIAVVGMLHGQSAKLEINSKEYGFSKTKRPDCVPEDCEKLLFSLTVLRSEKEKNLHEMTVEDRLEYATQRRLLGKHLFASQKPASAFKQYTKGLTALDQNWPTSGCPEDAESKRQELIQLYLINQTACLLKQKDYAETLALCNKVLLRDDRNIKALYRRAVAHKCRGDLDEAKRDYHKLKELLTAAEDPSGSLATTIERDLATIAAHAKTVAQAQRKKFDGMFKTAAAKDLYSDKPDVEYTSSPAGDLSVQGFATWLQDSLRGFQRQALSSVDWVRSRCCRRDKDKRE